MNETLKNINNPTCKTTSHEGPPVFDPLTGNGSAKLMSLGVDEGSIE